MSARDEGSRRPGRLLPPKPEAEVEDELAFHLEQRVRDYEARGMSPDEARRAATERLGDVRDVRRECAALLTAERRTTARRERLRVSWLDFKLGFRMLVKYPGLTIVGGLAMAFAICFGAVAYQLVSQFLYPTLTLADGDRVVRLANWDATTGDTEDRALHDFVAWQETLRTVTELGAFRDISRTLVAPGGEAQLAAVAEMTASGFRVARVAPLLGRPLVLADEHPGAPAVVVLGHDLWQRRFDGDSAIVGRTVQLGSDRATVVGVMPEGFGFPIAHEVWTPLRLNPLDHARREGPALSVFGRLAPGASLDEAQTELTAVGQRTAAEFPATHEHLRPRVAPYTSIFGGNQSGGDMAAMFSINVFVVLLLVLVCGNVALLVFARAASRESELVVRSALGASRGRIVAQLFAEALVLGGVAAAVGIAAAHLALGRWGAAYLEANEVRLPFWFEVTLSPAAVLYAAGLTVLGASIAGVLPALKVTRGLAGRLRSGTSGGGTLRFGGVWTAVIVAQVAVTVAFPAVGYFMQRELIRIRTFDVGFASEEFLAVRLDPEVLAAADAGDEAAWKAQGARFTASLEEVRRRVAAEPGVAGVTFVDRLPRDYHRERYVETDAAAADSLATHEVGLAAIDPSYFEVLEAPILAGRAFRAVDLAPDAQVAIVDQGFVERVLGGRNPIGVRVRFAPLKMADGQVEAEERPWFEIVGVVPDLGMAHAVRNRRAAGMYFPALPGSEGRVQLMVHAHGDPLALAPRVREIVAATDPTLRLSDVQRADEVTNSLLWMLALWLRGTAALSAIALLLSLAGIYAVLSFTVARRTREIGVRIALGATRGRVLAATFRRPLMQVALGVVAGGALIAAAPTLLAQGDGDMVGPLSPRGVVLIVAYATFMLGVCLLACIVPTRRALRIEPTEALRAEG